MSLETYIAFIGASFAILIVPGPSSTLVVAYTLSEGRRAIPAVVAGVLAGDFVSLSASLAGLGALVSASPTLFQALKWFGILYLLYLAYRSLKVTNDVSGEDLERPRISLASLALRGFVVTAVNPEGLGFFIDFMPQFMNADRPLLPQMLVMVATYVVLAVIARMIYALGAGAARSVLTSERAQRRIRWFSAAIMIAAAVWSVFALQHG